MRNSRVGFVESRLDEAIQSLKESIERSEARLEADRHATEARLAADREESAARLAADREESAARLSSDREAFERRFAEERKEWRETKRWLYINFGGVIAILITIAIAAFGFAAN